ncbi:hypothetical protein I2484_20015 [Sporosarcina sp. E16_8]|nr:hypothetical protein [Sporosarcina sp. E16_8]
MDTSPGWLHTPASLLDTTLFVAHSSEFVGHFAKLVAHSSEFVGHFAKFVAHSSEFVGHFTRFVAHSSELVGHYPVCCTLQQNHPSNLQPTLLHKKKPLTRFISTR